MLKQSSGSSGVALAADDVFRVKVELVAAGYLLASEEFYLHKKVRAKSVRSCFGKCLTEVEGQLFERLNNAVVPEDTKLYETLPDVTKYEFPSELVGFGKEKRQRHFDQTV